MAKTIPAPRRSQPGPSGGAAQSDAVGKFDKFSAFALALPCTVLALICLGVAVSYTNKHFSVGLFGLMGKTVQDWDGGSDQITSTSAVSIKGFEAHDYIGNVSEGEVDVAVIDAGSDHRVNLGDVFVLDSETPDVRLEFEVFEVQSNFCRAYILLGQNVEGGKQRGYSLKREDIVRLCGGNEDNIKVKRPWRDQEVRASVENRAK
jgi:hypothetical protein